MLDRFETAECRAEGGERADGLGQPKVKRAGGGERGERVVGVVQAGDRHADGREHVPHRPRQHELTAARAERDLRRGHIARGARETARRARPVAHVREDNTRVFERLLAARAARRVADRLRDDSADIGVVDAEEDRLRVAPEREVCDERIVRVQHERGVPGQAGQGIADLLRERVQLEVAVHLIAEEIGDHHHARPETSDRARQRRFVDLEKAEVAARLA